MIRKAIITNILNRVVGDEVKGYIDYFRSSLFDKDWSGPFNGQKAKCQLFDTLNDRFKFTFVVETGTFRGVTTEYVASRINVPVISIESSERNYGFARARLRKQRRVKLLNGNSVAVLQWLFEQHLFLPEGLGFYYLDAHWNESLPLREEVALIFTKRPLSVVMIDDFQVPDDPGYLYDDYGSGGALTFDYLSETISQLELFPFFPSCPSSMETGKKRGTLVLTTAMLVEELRQVNELRELPE